MRKEPARIILVIVTLALSVLTVWSWRYFARYRPFADLSQGPSMSDANVKIDTVFVRGTTHGIRTWDLHAARAILSHDRLDLNAQTVDSATLYSDKGTRIVSLSADSARFHNAFSIDASSPVSGLLTISGHVQALVYGPHRLTLQADRAIWNPVTNLLIVPGQTTARFAGGKATGQNLTIDVRSGQITLSDLHGTFVAAKLVH